MTSLVVQNAWASILLCNIHRFLKNGWRNDFILKLDMNKKITVVTGCNTIITDLNHFLKPDFSKHNFGSWKGSETCARRIRIPNRIIYFWTGYFSFADWCSIFIWNELFWNKLFHNQLFQDRFPGKNNPKWPYSA